MQDKLSRVGGGGNRGFGEWWWKEEMLKDGLKSVIGVKNGFF